jgi:hypothetical protein
LSFFAPFCHFERPNLENILKNYAVIFFDYFGNLLHYALKWFFNIFLQKLFWPNEKWTFINVQNQKLVGLMARFYIHTLNSHETLNKYIEELRIIKK